MQRNVLLALGVILVFGASVTAMAVAGQSPAQASSVAIPAMPLHAALQEFAEREKLQLLYESSIAAGLRTQGAPAGLPLRSALRTLLRGTGLRFKFISADTVMIMRGSDPKPDPPSGSDAPALPPSARPPAAQSAQNVEQSKHVRTLQMVIVTGTRAFDRTAAESLKPIDILTPQELQATGASNLSTALRTLLPSFNFPQPSLTDATDATQPAQLRGLSPNETLVLINGKRQHTTAILNINGSIGRGSSPVDLAAIPMNAVERIEVLRDGAAAQYGSSAIAGVINIILKGGANDHGSVSVTRGIHDRGQGQTWQGGANTGFTIGNNGWVHVSAEYLDQHPTNHAGPDVRYPKDPTFGKLTFHFGLPLERQKQAAINAQYELDQNATLYGFSVFNKRDVSAGGFFRSLSQYNSSTPAAALVYPDGYLPIENSAIRDDNTVLGIRGELAGWNYDISGDTGGNHWKLNTTDTFNYSLGAASPTAFYIGTLTIRQDVFNADFRRNFDVGWYHPLTVAWGLSYRQEKFTIKQGDSASYAGAGAQVFPGYQPGDAGSHLRHDLAQYIDLSADFTRELSAEFAARHTRYSDFGNNTSWSLSGRYAFTPVVALRATASTGFVAPSLQQEFYSSTAIEFLNEGANGSLVPFTIRTFPVSNPAAVALGAQPLHPEQSHNYGIGLVFTPAVGPYVTLDAYEVNIANRIVLSGNLVGADVASFLTSAGFPFVEGGRFFTNAVSTRTRGVDLVGTWPVPLQTSELKFTGGLNYNQTDVRAVKGNPPQLGLAGLALPVFDSEARGLMLATPKTKAFVAADWSRGNWRVHSQLTRYGNWTVLGSTPAGNQTYGARLLLDASVNYTLADRWGLSLGGNNITNTYPEKNDAPNSFHGILPYSGLSPFGFNGSYWYATANYRW